jgi:hypothetical protein
MSGALSAWPVTAAWLVGDLNGMMPDTSVHLNNKDFDVHR